MEFIFELIIELLFEGASEGGKNKKLPKPLRYFLIGVVLLFHLAIIGLIVYVGIISLENNKLLGTAIIVFGVLFGFLLLRKFRKVYIEKSQNKDQN